MNLLAFVHAKFEMDISGFFRSVMGYLYQINVLKYVIFKIRDNGFVKISAHEYIDTINRQEVND